MADVVGVVLPPSRTREVLRQLAVRPADGRAGLVDRERAHAGRARIDSHDEASRHAPHDRTGVADRYAGTSPSAVTEAPPELSVPRPRETPWERSRTRPATY